jgi:2-dehydropantoate 2-reductase
MKIAIIGAGAMGGFLAARLASAGEDVTVVDRGETLAAIKTNGLTLIEADGTRLSAEVRTAPRVADIGEQEIIILAVKAHQLAAVVTELPVNDCMVATAQNGIPWWYFHKHGGSYDGNRLESVDSGGVIADHLEIGRVVGCVLYPAAEVVSPGVIKHVEGKRISVAEIDGVKTERIQRLSAALRGAGLKAPVVSDIRTEIWTKLWGNLSFNPISALTHATLEEIGRDPLSRQLVLDTMAEAQRVAEAVALPCRFPKNSGSPPPRRSARIRRRCCKTSSEARVSRPMRLSAR